MCFSPLSIERVPGNFLPHAIFYNLKDVVISLLGMGDSAARAVFYAAFKTAFKSEIPAAVQKIKRAPAKKAGPPFLKVMAREKTAVPVDEIFVVHSVQAFRFAICLRRAFLACPMASGSGGNRHCPSRSSNSARRRSGPARHPDIQNLQMTVLLNPCFIAALSSRSQNCK